VDARGDVKPARTYYILPQDVADFEAGVPAVLLSIYAGCQLLVAPKAGLGGGRLPMQDDK